MRKLLKLLLFLLIPSLIQACLWLEGTTIDGNHKTFEDKTISTIFLEISQHTTAQKNFKRKFYRDNNQTKEYLALKDIMNNKYEQGIDRLLKIEKQYPNLYSTASNLGTAYELKGELPLAIQWIKEGIKRDSNSHYGTEWLHLLILKTKLELESNASLLNHKHIINLPNSFDETTTILIKNKPYTIKKIRDALFYQLQERLIFVKPKDTIVADLLYTFAKIEEQTTVLEEAKKLLDIAIEYGYNNLKDIASISRSLTEANIAYAFKNIFYGFGALLLLLILNSLIKKRRKNQIKKPLSPFFFALSINTHILLFSILFIPIYTSISFYFTHIIMFYFLLIPFYVIAIYFAFEGFNSRHIITKPKQSILYTLIIYIAFILFLLLNFIQDTHSHLIYYLVAHTFFALSIFYFLKLKLRKFAIITLIKT